jgi:hypothetical protein
VNSTSARCSKYSFRWRGISAAQIVRSQARHDQCAEFLMQISNSARACRRKDFETVVGTDTKCEWERFLWVVTPGEPVVVEASRHHWLLVRSVQNQRVCISRRRQFLIRLQDLPAINACPVTSNDLWRHSRA